MLSKQTNILQLVFLLFLGFVVIEQCEALPLPQHIPLYSRHCRDIKNKYGRVIERQCVERFRTKNRPPSHGFGHSDINQFLAWDSMNSRGSTNNVITSRRPIFATTPKTTTKTTTTTTTSTTTQRPTIKPNPEENTNPDYVNIFNPSGENDVEYEENDNEEVPQERNKEDEKEIIENYEYEDEPEETTKKEVEEKQPEKEQEKEPEKEKEDKKESIEKTEYDYENENDETTEKEPEEKGDEDLDENSEEDYDYDDKK